jgi:hypothetical protein
METKKKKGFKVEEGRGQRGEGKVEGCGQCRLCAHMEMSQRIPLKHTGNNCYYTKDLSVQHFVCHTAQEKTKETINNLLLIYINNLFMFVKCFCSTGV